MEQKTYEELVAENQKLQENLGKIQNEISSKNIEIHNKNT